MSEQKTESWRGKIGKLSPAEIDQFLYEPHLARIACLDDKGWPYAVPCWYHWDGKAFWLVARAKSKWARYLEAEPRCAVTVDQSSLADESKESGAGESGESGGGSVGGGGGVQRNVAAQCEAVIVERPNTGGRWVEIARTMALRYYGENGPAYLEPTMSWKRWLIRLDPVETWSWQGIAWPKSYLEGDAVAR
jgi:hypothetical protein